MFGGAAPQPAGQLKVFVLKHAKAQELLPVLERLFRGGIHLRESHESTNRSRRRGVPRRGCSAAREVGRGIAKAIRKTTNRHTASAPNSGAAVVPHARRSSAGPRQ